MAHESPERDVQDTVDVAPSGLSVSKSTTSLVSLFPICPLYHPHRGQGTRRPMVPAQRDTEVSPLLRVSSAPSRPTAPPARPVPSYGETGQCSSPPRPPLGVLQGRGGGTFRGWRGPLIGFGRRVQRTREKQVRTTGFIFLAGQTGLITRGGREEGSPQAPGKRMRSILWGGEGGGGRLGRREHSRSSAAGLG